MRGFNHDIVLSTGFFLLMTFRCKTFWCVWHLFVCYMIWSRCWKFSLSLYLILSCIFSFCGEYQYLYFNHLPMRLSAPDDTGTSGEASVFYLLLQLRSLILPPQKRPENTLRRSNRTFISVEVNCGFEYRTQAIKFCSDFFYTNFYLIKMALKVVPW